MIIAKAKIEDLDAVLKITEEAKTFLKENGVNQWQDGYPNKEVFKNDILNNHLYVVKEDEEALGFFSLCNYEETYEKIYDGKWNSDEDYVVVHRLAIADKHKGKGVSKYIFDYIKNKYAYLRVDTHKDNKAMQRCLIKNGFKYCGIIYLNRGGDNMRFAYDFKK